MGLAHGRGRVAVPQTQSARTDGIRLAWMPGVGFWMTGPRYPQSPSYTGFCFTSKHMHMVGVVSSSIVLARRGGGPVGHWLRRCAAFGIPAAVRAKGCPAIQDVSSRMNGPPGWTWRFCLACERSSKLHRTYAPLAGFSGTGGRVPVQPDGRVDCQIREEKWKP